MTQAKKPTQTTRKSTVSEFENAAGAAGLTTSVGKSAVKNQYQSGIAVGPGVRFTASLDIDTAFQTSEPQASRWDYGLGLQKKGSGEMAVWIEPHPASSHSEVSKIIAKLDWLEAKLALPAFKDLKRLTEKSAQAGILRFHWLAMTGDNRIRPGSTEARMLSKRGLRLPSRHLVLT